MKKILVLCLVGVGICRLVYADDANQQGIIVQSVKEYIQRCEDSSYPNDNPEKMKHIFSYYNTSIKEYLPKYNRCLKEIIIEKIKEVSDEERTEKMSEALDKIEEGILVFYGEMNSLWETGVVGLAENDNVLGRRLEAILGDVLNYHERKMYFPIDEEEKDALEHSYELLINSSSPR